MEADVRRVQYLYLTTKGRVTGLPREIEIWYVERAGNFYVLAEHFHRAQWVKNLVKEPRVQVRVGARRVAATARVLDPASDRDEWQDVQRLAREKYGWGEGLPVCIVPDQTPPAGQ